MPAFHTQRAAATCTSQSVNSLKLSCGEDKEDEDDVDNDVGGREVHSYEMLIILLKVCRRREQNSQITSL